MSPEQSAFSRQLSASEYYRQYKFFFFVLLKAQANCRQPSGFEF
jgi:hypothetical protein